MKLNTIIEGDSLNIIKEIPSYFIDIIITSPPYNAAHNYDNYNDNQKFNDYISNMKEIFTECYRVLKKGGRICVNVPFAIKNKETKEVTFISHYIASILNEIGFKDFEWITWHKGKNMNHFQGNNTAWGSWKSPSCPSFRPLGEAIMVFYKEEKRHIGKKENIDITADEFKAWTKNTWYFNEEEDNIYENLVCIPNDAKKKDHPAPYPKELVKRLLKMYSYKNEIVLDPFNGIGTTTLASEELNRKYIGIDLSKKYCDIASERLSNCTRLVYNNETTNLVNTSSNENTLNLVFPYKESFSPSLVPYLIKRYNIKKYTNLLDPFLGTGSVFINDKVKHCYGFDTSPLAIEISKAKLIKLNRKDLNKALKMIKEFSDKNIEKTPYPIWEPFSKYAEAEKYNIVMSFIKYFSEEQEDLFRFIKYIIISNLDKIFDYKRDGNGIKYRKSKLTTDDVVFYLKELLENAIKLKKEFDKTNNKTLYFKNSSSTTDTINEKVDLVVTSPPYANMFDYFEVYKMELWTSGLIKTYDDWKKLKKSALRSNKNANINNADKIENSILQIAIKSLETTTIETSVISMINNYFYDMKEVLKNMYTVLNDNSYMFIVVGNSFYKTIPIITDEILIEEAEKIGFSCEEMIISRKLSTSSQQMKKIKAEDKKYLRESIIVLKKGGKENEKKN